MTTISKRPAQPSEALIARVIAASRSARALRGDAIAHAATTLERAMAHVDAGALALADAVLRGLEHELAITPGSG